MPVLCDQCGKEISIKNYISGDGLCPRCWLTIELGLASDVKAGV